VPITNNVANDVIALSAMHLNIVGCLNLYWSCDKDVGEILKDSRMQCNPSRLTKRILNYEQIEPNLIILWVKNIGKE